MKKIINPYDVGGIRQAVKESEYITVGKNKVNQVYIKEYGSDEWELLRNFEGVE